MNTEQVEALTVWAHDLASALKARTLWLARDSQEYHRQKWQGSGRASPKPQ